MAAVRWGEKNVTGRKPVATYHTLTSAFQMLLSVSFSEVFSHAQSRGDRKAG